MVATEHMPLCQRVILRSCWVVIAWVPFVDLVPGVALTRRVGWLSVTLTEQDESSASCQTGSDVVLFSQTFNAMSTCGGDAVDAVVSVDVRVGRVWVE